MLKVMKPCTSRYCYLLAGAIAICAIHSARAEDAPNPYQAIVERNAFGLKPPPPVVEPPPIVAPAPSSKVVLTGIATVFGVKALLEITEQEPGKQPSVRKPILREGERDGSIEVISINVEKSFVKIKNGNIETNVTFDTPKLAGAGPVPNLAGFTPPPLGNPFPGTPNALTPANANATPAGKGNNFNVFGGAGSSVAASTKVATSPVNTFGGQGTAPNTGAGLRSIPNRTMRSDNTVIYGNQPQVDGAKQYLNMAIQHELQTRQGQAVPPLPPPPGGIPNQ